MYIISVWLVQIGGICYNFPQHLLETEVINEVCEVLKTSVVKQNVRLEAEVIPQFDQDILQELLPPYKVILHNDDHNSMGYVLMALMKSVPSISENEAVEIMLTAHNEGTAIVVVCPLEAAEHYQDRILSFGITATIEKDE